MKNYNVTRKGRETKLGGGIILAVHRKLGYIEIEINENIEAIGVKIKLDQKILSIVNIDMPTTTPVDNIILDKMIDKLSTFKIVLGDFNAHHTSWDIENSLKGKKRAEWIKVSKLVVLTL